MMKRLLLSKKRSVFTTWIGSYIVIILLSVVISGIVYYETGKTFALEVNRFNMLSLRQMQNALDRRLGEIETLSIQIAWNPTLDCLYLINSRLEGHEVFNIYTSIRNLKLSTIANSFIKDIYIYIKRPDYVLTTATYTESSMAFDYFHKGGEMEYSEWKKLMEAKHIQEYITIDCKEDNGRLQKCIAYLQTLPIENAEQSLATMVILMDPTGFQEAIKDINWIKNGYVVILDEENNIIASTGKQNENFGIDYKSLEKTEKTLVKKIQGRTSAITYINSRITDWKYIYIAPMSDLMGRINYVRMIAVLGVVFCILAGVSLAYYLTIRNYHPVSGLVEFISQRDKTVFNKGNNEFFFIQNVINKSFDEKDKYLSKLKEQDKVMRINYLQRLLNGRADNKILTADLAESYGIRFTEGYYSVVLMYIEDYDNQMLKMNDLDEELDLVKLIVANVIDELANRKYVGYIVEINEMLALIMNYTSNDNAVIERDVAQIAEEAISFLTNKFHIKLTLSSGRLYSNIYDLHASYRDALEAMDYKLVMGSGIFIGYNDIKDSKGSFYYPFELEYRFINCIKSGDSKGAGEFISSIFEGNIAKGKPSIYTARCIMFNLVGIMLKTIEELRPVIGDSLDAEVNLTDYLISSDTLTEMKQRVNELLGKICGRINTTKKSQGECLKEQLITYIEHNYGNYSLTVGELARHFQLTPAYITRLFKEQTGEGLLEYINRTRVDKSKMFLMEERISIQDLAKKVGYENTGTFIRLFKKYEGVTPVRYKEIINDKGY